MYSFPSRSDLQNLTAPALTLERFLAALSKTLQEHALEGYDRAYVRFDPKWQEPVEKLLERMRLNVRPLTVHVSYAVPVPKGAIIGKDCLLEIGWYALTGSSV